MPELKDENQEYEVEKIKDNTVKAGYIQYLVKWLGWLLEYNQQIPKDDIVNVVSKIKSFKRLYKWKYNQD